MKVKIAGFKVLPINEYTLVSVLDHEPYTAGFVQVTEWVEVELPDLDEATIAGLTEVQTNARIAELEKQVSSLRATRQEAA